MSYAKDKQWLQNFIDKHDLGDELADIEHVAMEVDADMSGAQELYDDLLALADEDILEAAEKEKTKVLKGLVCFIKDMQMDREEEMEEDEEVYESKDEFVTPKDNKIVKEVTQTPVIQGALSDKAFKYLFTWDELKNRTKDASWMYDQIHAMLEKGEKLDEVEKMIEKLEADIKKFAEFYRKRYEIKLGYLRTRLNELKSSK